VDVARILDYWPEAIEYGTANRFRPTQRCVRFHATEINTGGICAGSVPEGIPSGSRQHYGTSKSLQKPPASTRAESHQKTNLAPAWNANGVLPGAIWLMKPSANGSAPCRVSCGSDASGVQSKPIAAGALDTQFAE